MPSAAGFSDAPYTCVREQRSKPQCGPRPKIPVGKPTANLFAVCAKDLSRDCKCPLGLKLRSHDGSNKLPVCPHRPACSAGPKRATCGLSTAARSCRTLAVALTATNAGGEIDVLDPAGYDSLTITKAISIVNDGVGTAGVIVPSGVGITINAGTSDAVSLRDRRRRRG